MFGSAHLRPRHLRREPSVNRHCRPNRNCVSSTTLAACSVLRIAQHQNSTNETPAVSSERRAPASPLAEADYRLFAAALVRQPPIRTQIIAGPWRQATALSLRAGWSGRLGHRPGPPGSAGPSLRRKPPGEKPAIFPQNCSARVTPAWDPGTLRASTAVSLLSRLQLDAESNATVNAVLRKTQRVPKRSHPRFQSAIRAMHRAMRLLGCASACPRRVRGQTRIPSPG